MEIEHYVRRIKTNALSCILLKPMFMNRILLILFFFVFSFRAFSQTEVKEVAYVSDSYHLEKNPVKKSSIKIYPNPSYGKISVSAITSTPLHFYIFDLEGTLVYQVVLNNKDRKNIESLKKGTYTYDVF